MSGGHNRARLRRWMENVDEESEFNTSLRLKALDEALLHLASDPALAFDPSLFLLPGVPRIRPLLVLLCARAAASGAPAPLGIDDGTDDVAVAVELLNLAVAIHDAAFGRRGGRRRRVAKRVLGGAVGLLGGSHLTLRALELARHAPTPEVMGDLIDTIREVTEGEALAAELRLRMATPLESMDHADSRSGALFAFACRAGAWVGGGERKVVNRLGRYGRHTGIAVHLAEELQIFTSDDAAVGHELHERISRGRVLHTVAACDAPGLEPLWAALQESPDDTAAGELIRLARQHGGTAATRERLVLETWTARQALRTIQDSPHRRALDDLARALAG